MLKKEMGDKEGARRDLAKFFELAGPADGYQVDVAKAALEELAK